jgi:uncharacterized protein
MAIQSLSTANSALVGGVSGGFQAKRRFYDDVHFPKGFKRCGDFTSKEAELLEQYGQVLQDLASGKQLPCCADEAQFVEVTKGNIHPITQLELLWVKYCRLAKGKPFYAVVGTVHAPASKPEVETSFDIDDEPESDTEIEDAQQ